MKLVERGGLQFEGYDLVDRGVFLFLTCCISIIVGLVVLTGSHCPGTSRHESAWLIVI